MNLGYTHNKQCQVSFTLGWGLFGVGDKDLNSTSSVQVVATFAK